MKTYVLTILFFISLTSCSCGQNGKEIKIDPDFKVFMDVFPKRELPFRVSADPDIGSSFETPLPKMPKEYANKYIKINELEKDLFICPDEFIYVFLAFSRFEISKKFVAIEISISADAGCGERDLFITYNLQGEYIDHLIIYGSSFLKRPSNEDRSHIMLFHQGLIDKDTIEVNEKVIDYSSKNKIISEVTTTKIYNIEDDGAFRLVEEKVQKL